MPRGEYLLEVRSEEIPARMLEPGVKEAKFNCPGVGFVKAVDVQGPETRLVLRHIVH